MCEACVCARYHGRDHSFRQTRSGVVGPWKKNCRKKQQPHTHTHTKLLITYNHQHQQSSIIITTILNITTTRSFVSTVPLIPVRTDLSTGAVWECDFWRIL